MANATSDVVVIGAGIAGLAAGCYAQMNGYQTQIFELHDQPGGLCTAWQRQGYTFDGCLYYLFGSGAGQPFHQIWAELGAVRGRKFVHHDELMRIVAPNGKTLIVYSNPDQLEAHLHSLSDKDCWLIKDFCDGIRAMAQFDLSLLYRQPKSSMGLAEWMRLSLKLAPFIRPLSRWGNISAREFGNRFQDPFLRRAIPQMFSWSTIPVMVGMSLIAYTHNGNAGVPIGGSLEFAQSIAQRYLELGGKIHYNAQVEKILVTNQQAVGVRLYNHEEYYADRVIAACDGRGTLLDLLRGASIGRSLQQLYDGHLPIHAQLQVSLGVNRDLSGEPHWATYLLDKPMEIAGEIRSEISVKHYCFDSSLAPPGKSVITMMLTTPYAYWQRIYGRSLYHAEKIQESDLLIEQLECFYPGITTDIEVVDVATPLTYERYTGNWQGSSCGWLLTKQTLPLTIKGISKTIPGLRGLYSIGQWVEPGGGVPIVAMSGRTIVQQICHEDRRIFKTTIDGVLVEH
jgi:phytoene dehydrogenase-like protein